MKIGNHEIFSFHTNRETDMRTVLLHDGCQWVTAIIPKSLGSDPAEWWQGHYHGKDYDRALRDFLLWSGLNAGQEVFARRAQALLDEWEAGAAPVDDENARDQEAEEAAANSTEDRAITLLYDLADTL
ncbi:hypothetical protein [Streptomyces murinus]|uniref:hypothetical protein n=1 Tax=Streptomyces murinus TaxID=33900 RepID=UPI0037FE4582